MTILNLMKIAESSLSFENTVAKGEIACYKQFLLFPQCFQKACFLEVSKGVIVWEWVKAGGLLLQVVSNTGLTVLESYLVFMVL